MIRFVTYGSDTVTQPFSSVVRQLRFYFISS
jgi:hypothetical protein